MSEQPAAPAVDFQALIQGFCDEIGWKIAEINEKRAVLGFNMESGRSQTLFILRFDDTLEFSVPSIAAFESEDQIPHQLSTMLLQRSSQKKIGFWCIEQIGGKQTFEYMHNERLEHLNATFFAQVVESLINECDYFEGTLAEMMNQGNQGAQQEP